ncbi:MAG: hypothetical protein ACR5KW_04075 [Wolbachia sp.]
MNNGQKINQSAKDILKDIKAISGKNANSDKVKIGKRKGERR